MSKLVKVIVTNSWDNDNDFEKEMSLEEALEDIKESAYEDETEIECYLLDYPMHTIKDFVDLIVYSASKDLKNGYTYEYRGSEYQPVFEEDDNTKSKKLINKLHDCHRELEACYEYVGDWKDLVLQYDDNINNVIEMIKEIIEELEKE